MSIDKQNRSIHCFSSPENKKDGTSAINSVDKILKIRRLLNLVLNYKLPSLKKAILFLKNRF